MLTREQNEALTRTGPGTPGGALLRRYWQPIALAREMPPGAPPLSVDVMGEELVLFRDDQGRLGLLDRHCCHRGTDLSYGRLECGGLRCLYHGWLYDVNGRCLEQPGEPATSTFKDRVRQPAYAVVERGGAFFAYLGGGEPPEFPDYDFFTFRPRIGTPRRSSSTATTCRRTRATTIPRTSASCTRRSRWRSGRAYSSAISSGSASAPTSRR
jgi:phenylpropionate dioxygenase-like ring-hydroxylating dioxygenase large terminal subunit